MEVALFLFLLTVKHAVADLMLQSRFGDKYGDKSNLRDSKGYRHALDHSIGTFLVCIPFVDSVYVTYQLALSIALLDFVLHFMIDYCKTIYVRRSNVAYESKKFWTIQSVDQILHYTCYLLYCYIFLM
tara:strand:+ start:12 stop:395 length:384 start_codon:yes stop_codon:yes gene_type:complete